MTGSALTPGVIAAIQIFGDRINPHMHLHFLVTEGGTDEAAVSPVLMNRKRFMSAGVFHKILRIDDSRLAEIFAREVLAMLVRKELLSPEWAERILFWPHSGFNVHSHIFIARVTSHIPDKGQVMVRYFGLYANAHRGKVKKASLSVLRIVEEELRRLPSKGWAALIRKPHIGLRSAAMIRKVYEVDPMLCPKCGGRMKVIVFLTNFSVVDRIIGHLKLTFVAERPPPPQVALQQLLMAADPPAEYFS